MAGSTAASDLGVVNLGGRLPHRSRMTTLAGIARQNMGGGFAGGADAVVTTRTAAHYPGVIEPSRRPGDGAMA